MGFLVFDIEPLAATLSSRVPLDYKMRFYVNWAPYIDSQLELRLAQFQPRVGKGREICAGLEVVILRVAKEGNGLDGLQRIAKPHGSAGRLHPMDVLDLDVHRP